MAAVDGCSVVDLRGTAGSLLPLFFLCPPFLHSLPWDQKNQIRSLELFRIEFSFLHGYRSSGSVNICAEWV